MSATLRQVMHPEGDQPANLDELVTVVATTLMGVDSAGLKPAAETPLLKSHTKRPERRFTYGARNVHQTRLSLLPAGA